jgi:hypothetical protein
MHKSGLYFCIATADHLHTWFIKWMRMYTAASYTHTYENQQVCLHLFLLFKGTVINLSVHISVNNGENQLVGRQDHS